MRTRINLSWMEGGLIIGVAEFQLLVDTKLKDQPY